MNFVDAEPIVNAPGRKAADNPFSEVIAAIAGKTNKETGKPVAKSYVETHEAGARDKMQNRVRRLLSDAGDALNPAVTVRTAFVPIKVKDVKGNETDSDTQTAVTFWTRSKIVKKSTDVAGTASTPQSVAVAAPTE